MRQLYTKVEKIHKTIQEHRIHKTENKHKKQENKYKKNIQKQNSGNYNKTKRSNHTKLPT